jgi:hypothetical protein
MLLLLLLIIIIIIKLDYVESSTLKNIWKCSFKTLLLRVVVTRDGNPNISAIKKITTVCGSNT